jgi:putative oxidoreductase
VLHPGIAARRLRNFHPLASASHIHLAERGRGTLENRGMWAFLSRNRDAGLLMLRLTLGALFLWAHGWEKLTGGTAKWREFGEAMKHLGITFWPTFWGFMATMAETIGVALFMIGLAFRPACLLIAFTLAVAGIHAGHVAPKGMTALKAASHAWELGLVFFSMIFIGPGKYSVDKN